MTGHNKSTSKVRSRSSFVINGMSNSKGGAEVLGRDDSRGSVLGDSLIKAKKTKGLSSTNSNTNFFLSLINSCCLSH